MRSARGDHTAGAPPVSEGEGRMPASSTNEGRRGRLFAWGYVAPPLHYPHAVPQWKRQLTDLAIEVGYHIDRWFEDTPGRSDGVTSMWTQLRRNSRVQALFVPHPSILEVLPALDGLSLQQMRDAVPYRIFVLNESFAPIQPPSQSSGDPLVDIVRGTRRPPRQRHWDLRMR